MIQLKLRILVYYNAGIIIKSKENFFRNDIGLRTAEQKQCMGLSGSENVDIKFSADDVFLE